jgi:hypothetical protein
MPPLEEIGEEWEAMVGCDGEGGSTGFLVGDTPEPNGSIHLSLFLRCTHKVCVGLDFLQMRKMKEEAFIYQSFFKWLLYCVGDNAYTNPSHVCIFVNDNHFTKGII